MSACDKGENVNPNTDSTDALTTTADSEVPTHSEGSTQDDLDSGVESGCANLEPARKGDFMVATDDELREFEGVVCVDGVLYVYGDVTDLRPLHALQKVKYIEVARSPLRTLSGLETLTIVVGDLIIDRMVELESLDALSNLTTIGRHLVIGSRSGGVDHKPEDGNDKLTSLHGLEGLRRVESIYIESNDALVDIGALGGIVSPVVSLALSDNTMLPLENVEALAAKLGVTARQCGCLGEPLCPADGD
jgi:hypothetical protein